MLVFSLRQDEKDEEIHPLVRLIDRTQHISIEQFVRIVADINEYLPDDWRMTDHDQEFRILISIQGQFFSLIGWSFRHNQGILHIIDTVLLPSMKVTHATGEARLQPNLYYFMPRPDYSPSPLFARQFEKIKKTDNKQSGTQYHRIHPLTKSGADPDHYHWIKWNSASGHIETVDYPEEGYHGKNYWVLQDLAQQHGRARNLQPYVAMYGRIINDYLKQSPLPPEPAPSPYELECKLLWPDLRKEDFTELHSSILKILAALDLKILLESKSFAQTDVYFDDEKKCLYRNGMSFRLRKRNNYVQITLKATPPEGKETNSAGWYRRFEEEAPISKEQEAVLLAGQRIAALPCRLISYLAPHCGTLAPVAEVATERVVITIANSGNQRAEVCLDQVRFLSGGKPIGADVEIEIESKGMPRKDVEAIAELLKDLVPKPAPSQSSKYERAIQYALEPGETT